MIEKSSTLRVGLFVLAGLSLLIASLLIFGGQKRFFTRHYSLKVQFNNIQGLAKGSVVSLAGVEIGNVSNIDFDEQGSLITTMSLDRAYSKKITTNSIASLRTQGALGDKYIYIHPGTAGGTVLDEGDFVHAEQPTDLFDLITSKADDVTAFVDAARELQTLLHNMNNNGRSDQIAENLVEASRHWGTLMADPNLRASFIHLKNVLKKIDDGQGTLGAIVNDRAIYDRILSLLGDSPRNSYLKPLIREAIKQNERNERP